MNNISLYRTQLMGVSILLIMLFHSSVGWTWTIVTRFFVRGDIGVEFFLLLSALGLYHSLQTNSNIMAFYKRRVLRILPTYLLVAIPVFLFFARYTPEGFKNIFWDISTLSCFIGNTRYWFIHLIIICYMVSPIYFKYVNSRYATIAFPICLAFIMTGITFLFPKYDIILSRLSIFLLGFHLAKYVLGGARNIRYPILLFILSIATLYSISFLSWHPRWIRLTYFFISVPILISLANIIPYAGEKMNNILVFFGRYTLEFYMVHESICTTIVWKYYHENVYVYIILCLIMAIPLVVSLKYMVKSIFSRWI